MVGRHGGRGCANESSSHRAAGGSHPRQAGRQGWGSALPHGEAGAQTDRGRQAWCGTAQRGAAPGRFTRLVASAQRAFRARRRPLHLQALEPQLRRRAAPVRLCRWPRLALLVQLVGGLGGRQAGGGGTAGTAVRRRYRAAGRQRQRPCGRRRVLPVLGARAAGSRQQAALAQPRRVASLAPAAAARRQRRGGGGGAAARHHPARHGHQAAGKGDASQGHPHLQP